MNRPHAAAQAAARSRLAHAGHAGYGGAIEWEELPSLTERLVMLSQPSLAERLEAASPPAWLETMPLEFDALPPSQPFREALEGLSTREVHEPEIFAIFFGGDAR